MSLDDFIDDWNDAFPIYVSEGIASSGPAKPNKRLVNKLGQKIADLVATAGGGSSLAYATVSSLNADLAHAANTEAAVYADPGGDTTNHNGVWTKIGASGSGSWQWLRSLSNVQVGLRLDALEAIDAEDRLTALEDEADVMAAYRRELVVRPGDAKELFTDGFTGTPDASVVTARSPVVTANGKVLQVSGAGIIARRGWVRLEPGRKYLARAIVQRATDPIDPLGDAVEFGMAWFTNVGAPISGTPISVVGTFSALTVVSGRTQKQAIIASASGDDITDVAPAGTVYCRPYIRSYGADGLTNVEVLEVRDVTDSIGDAIAESLVTDAIAAAATVQSVETEVQSLRDDAVNAAAAAGTDLWPRPVEEIIDNLTGSESDGYRALLSATNVSHPNQVVEIIGGNPVYSGAPKQGQFLNITSLGARYQFTTTYGWQNAERSRWRSSEFDLVPDGGSSDQSSALTAILTAATASDNPRDREIVLKGNGVVKISSEINLDSYENIRLICDKNLRIIPGSSRQFLFKTGYSSSVTGLVSLSADAPAGAAFVQVADTSSFTIGQWLWLQSEATLPGLNSGGGNGGTPLKRSQIARLLYKDSTKLYVDRCLDYNYLASDTAKVGIAPMKGGWTFENVQYGSIGDTTTFIGNMFSGIFVRDTKFIHPIVENSRTDVTTSGDNTASNAIGLDGAIDCVVDDPQMRMIGYYAIAYNGPCNNIEIRGGHIANARHAFSANWTGIGGYGEPVNIRHYGTQIDSCSLSGVRNHDVGKEFLYNRIRSNGSLGDRGFVFESQGHVLEDCEGRFNLNDGVFVAKDSLGTKVRGGDFSDNSRMGINAAAPIDVIGTDVSRNGLVNTQSGSCGLSLVGGRVSQCRVDDNKNLAVVYGPNDDSLTLSRLAVESNTITRTSNQTVLIYQYDKSGYSTALLTLKNNDLTGWDPSSDYFVAKGTSSTTPAPAEPDHSGNTFSDESAGNETRLTAVLVAGAKTVSTTKVFKFAGGTGGGGGAQAPFISKVRPQLRTAGGTPGNVRISAATDRTSFVITSDNAADTSTYDWWLEH